MAARPRTKAKKVRKLEQAAVDLLVGMIEVTPERCRNYNPRYPSGRMRPPNAKSTSDELFAAAYQSVTATAKALAELGGELRKRLGIDEPGPLEELRGRMQEAQSSCQPTSPKAESSARLANS